MQTVVASPEWAIKLTESEDMGKSTRIADDQKLEILRSGGYRYDFDRALYVNRKAKKAFSVEFIEDNSPDDLAQLVGGESFGSDWHFFFNTEPSSAVKQQLANMLG